MKTAHLTLLAVVEPLESRIAPAFAPVINLAELYGGDGFSIPGVDPEGHLGYAVNTAGDVNNDGFTDIIISAPLADAAAVDAGICYVVFGTSAPLRASFDLAELNGANGFRVGGQALDDVAGLSVSTAGDINGDGFDDVVIGVPYADPGGDRSGAAYVIFGKGTAFPAAFDLSTLNGVNGFKFTGGAIDELVGSVVAPVGDINGDTFDDLGVGATGRTGVGTDSGAVYILFGKSTTFPPTVPALSLNGSTGFRIDGAAAFDNLGNGIAAAGDVNNDGRDDLIVGAPLANASANDSGSAYVFYGRVGLFPAAVSVTSLDGSNGFSIEGEADGDYAGGSVAGVGDVNGDGFDDVLIGASGADPNGGESGAGYIVFGRATAISAAFALGGIDGANGFKLTGAKAGDGDGGLVAAAGDLNGDTLADFLISAPRSQEAGVDAGAVYAVFGRASFPAVVALDKLDGSNGFRIDAAGPGGMLADAVGVRDFNGDGHADLVLGASGIFLPEAVPGAAYVVFGPFPRPAPDQPSPTVLTYTEPDGDRITIRATKGTLPADAALLQVEGDGVVLRSLDLSENARKLNGAKITITVKPPEAGDPRGPLSDGQASVGSINAVGAKLKSIFVSGSLTAFTGDSKKLLKQLKVGSIGPGVFDDIVTLFDIPGGIGQLIVGGDVLGAKVTGKKLGALKVTGDVTSTTLESAGPIGRVSVEGNVLASTIMVGDTDGIGGGGIGQLNLGGLVSSILQAGGNIGRIKVSGSVNDSILRVGAGVDLLVVVGDLFQSIVRVNGRLDAAVVEGDVIRSVMYLPGKSDPRNAGKALVLGRLDITGDLRESRVLAGYIGDDQPVNADVRIGKVTVGGDYAASNLVAGVLAGADTIFGTDDDTLIPDGNNIVSQIANVVIKGSVVGTAGPGDGFGVVAEELGKFTIGDSSLDLSRGPRNDLTSILLGGTNDVRAREVGDDT